LGISLGLPDGAVDDVSSKENGGGERTVGTRGGRKAQQDRGDPRPAGVESEEACRGEARV